MYHIAHIQLPCLLPKGSGIEGIAINAKNGADCYSKNGDAVTVLTWQS